MSKPLKSKKDKVPKITEEQYAEYLSALKAAEENEPRRTDKTLISPVVDYKNND